MSAVAAAVLTPSPAKASALPKRCESVFRSKIQIRNSNLLMNNFTVDRGLSQYENHFPFKTARGVKVTLASLPKKSVWFDMGAGKGHALVDGLKLNSNLTAIGVSYVRPGKSADLNIYGERAGYLEGDYVENMMDLGRLKPYLGRVNVITDVYGPFSYTNDVPRLLQTYLDLLETDGVLFVNFLVDRKIEHDPYARVGYSSMNSVLKSDGTKSNAGILEWLMQIEGIQVLDAARAESEPGAVHEKSIGLKIKKTATHVTVPSNLKLETYEADSPPRRTFRR